MDIIVHCGGNTHVMTDKEKEDVLKALRLARKHFEDSAKQNRWLAIDAAPRMGEILTGIAAVADEQAADFDGLIPYFTT